MHLREKLTSRILSYIVVRWWRADTFKHLLYILVKYRYYTIALHNFLRRGTSDTLAPHFQSWNFSSKKKLNEENKEVVVSRVPSENETIVRSRQVF